MYELDMLAFVPASGFAAAGFLGALHRVLGGEGPGFRLNRSSAAAAVWSFFVCMFAGPYIVGSGTWRTWRAGRLPHAMLLPAALLVLVWSFCAGAFVAQFWMLTGMIQI